MHQRLEARPEEGKDGFAEVDAEGTADKVFHEMRDAVSGDRVHADHHQWECPLAIALDLNDPAEGGQEQEA